jgi:membrane protease YdiL (CAAX protease family)
MVGKLARLLGKYGFDHLVLALVMGLISFPLLFFPNIQVMKPFGLVIAWFLFAVFNSTCEEAYWRGFLLDETSHMPRVFGVIYSTIFFTAIHPLMLGVFSKVNAFDPARPTALIPFWIILVILSLAFSLLYLKTKSLRLPTLAHFLSDLGNLSIFLFMNMVTM